MTWLASTHAAKRAVERFGITHDNVNTWFNEKLTSARYVCNTVDDDGSEARLFVNGKIMFFAALYEDIVKSVRYASRTQMAADCIAELAEKELRKRQVKALEAERSYADKKAQLETRRIDINIAILRTKSAPRIANLTASLAEVEAELCEVLAAVKRAKRELTSFAEGYVSITA
ncbi:hypothetical protein MKX34_24065 [Paenibacillus sp. FSL R5-0636]|uniref:hypothetical protein n=1 Tax=Paenibacillus TaxID=44249 RepID=UPI00096DB022|nr:hypothetical protein [Paenibacillus odorifer]OMC96244.1 hypothetical protein BJP49_11120 [Paenibacillus odorifer]